MCAVAVADAGAFRRAGVCRRAHRPRLVGSDARLLRRHPPSGPGRPSCLFALVALAIDALLGRAHGGLLVLAPLVLIPAWISSEKGMYLSRSLLPDRLPLCAPDRRTAAAAGQRPPEDGNCAGRRRRCRPAAGRSGVPRLAAARAPADAKGRLARLALTVPALAVFVSIMDYATFSWARDRLQIIPMMWDQKENYAFNGFTLAFALNLPMADVPTPPGYSARGDRQHRRLPGGERAGRQARHHHRDERVLLGPDQAARGHDHPRSDPDRAGSCAPARCSRRSSAA